MFSDEVEELVGCERTHGFERYERDDIVMFCDGDTLYSIISIFDESYNTKSRTRNVNGYVSGRNLETGLDSLEEAEKWILNRVVRESSEPFDYEDTSFVAKKNLSVGLLRSGMELSVSGRKTPVVIDEEIEIEKSNSRKMKQNGYGDSVEDIRTERNGKRAWTTESGNLVCHVSGGKMGSTTGVSGLAYVTSSGSSFIVGGVRYDFINDEMVEYTET